MTYAELKSEIIKIMKNMDAFADGWAGLFGNWRSRVL